MENIVIDKIDILIPIIISILLVIIGINEDYNNKEYHKKYLMTIYFMVTIVNAYLIIKGFKNLLLLNIVFYFIISAVGSINLAYNIGQIEGRMKNKDLFILKFFEWMFIIRSYVYFTYMILLSIVPLLIIKSYKSILIFKVSIILSIVLIFIFIIKHLLDNAKDLFRFQTFDSLNEIFDERINLFNERYNIVNINKNEKHIDIDNIIEYMAFIVFMEDKDLFDRRSLCFSPKVVRERKNKLKSKRYHSVFKKYKISNRGYSTIPQQAFRRIALKEHAYTKSTKIRRKIFIENIYMPYFFKYYKENKNLYIHSINGNKKTYSDNMLKVDILKMYVQEVMKYPSTKKELLDSLSTNSKKPTREQYEYYYKEFKKSTERKTYIDEIRGSFYRYYKESKNILLDENDEVY